MHLFKMEVEPFGLHSQLSHVLFPASRVTADEVGDYLLVEVLLPVYAVENPLELLELGEGRLAHQSEHLV